MSRTSREKVTSQEETVPSVVKVPESVLLERVISYVRSEAGIGSQDAHRRRRHTGSHLRPRVDLPTYPSSLLCRRRGTRTTSQGSDLRFRRFVLPAGAAYVVPQPAMRARFRWEFWTDVGVAVADFGL